MNKYGYLLNLNYTPKEGEVIWQFERWENTDAPTMYNGIEGIDVETCKDYVIIGNAEEFNNWILTEFTPNIDFI